MLELSREGVSLKAIWFRALTPGELPPFGLGATLRCAYKLNRNRWRGRESLQLMNRARRAALTRPSLTDL